MKLSTICKESLGNSLEPVAFERNCLRKTKGQIHGGKREKELKLYLEGLEQMPLC